MNQSAFPRVIYPKWRAVLIGAVMGAAIGAILFKTILGTTFAVTVIQAGRLGGEQNQDTRITPQLIIDRRGAPQVLVDKLQTPEFAKQIADSLGDPSLLQSLPARQYGGNGKLGVRIISDGTLIEVRVLLSDPQQALSVAKAAAKFATDMDTGMLSELRKAYAERISELQKQAAAQQAMSDAIAKALEGNTTSPALLTAASDSQTKIQALSQSMWTVKAATLSPAAQESAIFIAPTLARPLIRNLWMALLVGIVGGVSLGYAFGLSTRFARLALENNP